MSRTAVRSVVFAAACLSLTKAAGARELTFEERVAAEEKIQRVSYAHQVGTTRPFEQAVPRAFLEPKVRAFLERADALERFWRTRIDEEALLREWQRIERESQYPDRLREIYRALGNDPMRIAECFVRPVLTQRLTDGFFDQDERVQADVRQRVEKLHADLAAGVRPAEDRGAPTLVHYVVAGKRSVADDSTIELSRAEYDTFRARLGTVEEDARGFTVRTLVDEDADGASVAEYFVAKPNWHEWWSGRSRALGLEARIVDTVWRSERALAEVLTPRVPGSCPADDTWDNGPFDDVPVHMSRHAAVWTGTEMLVWAGVTSNLTPYQAGRRYDPTIDTWTHINEVGSPSSRQYPTAVWTGNEMLVWGGQAGTGGLLLNTGGRYNPATDTWQPISTVNAPAARVHHTAVWTGSKMIVWGGEAPYPLLLNGDGASYDPSTDTWTPLSNVNAPTPRESHTAVWTGSAMVIWGGVASSTKLNTGASYDPVTDSWTPLTTTGAPAARAFHTAVWTGSEMIVFGGTDQLGILLQTGSRWSAAGGWSATTTTGAPQGRGLHTAVWTGSRMLIWGGGIGGSYGNGRAYDPALNQWGPDFSSTNSPSSRLNHTAVWTGDRMIVWGGEVDATTPTYTGGRYDPATDTWTPTSTGGAAGNVGDHSGSPLSTGTELMFLSYRAPGWAYNPLTNTERIIPASGRPAGSTTIWRNPTWTGEQAVLWGDDEGEPCCSLPGHGLLYNPIGDVWKVMSTFEAPWPRTGHSVVWTGSLVIIWGGGNTTNTLADGQRYDLANDIWLADIPTDDAPLQRNGHCAFWDGDEMIVYGGSGPQGPTSGGRFHLATNTWSPMATGPVPGDANKCVWTGSELLVLQVGAATNARYDPANDTWTLVPGTPSGLGFKDVARIWTGTHFVFWGGVVQDGDGGFRTNNGARFDPTTNAWQLTSVIGAPSPRTAAFYAWTGRHVLLAGGFEHGIYRDGGRYVVNPDAEGDGVPELCDNCPGLANSDQADADADDVGDACDSCTDLDGDAFGDPGFPLNTCGLDNCPSNANPSQADFDTDGAGDVCDSCTDIDHDAFGNPGFPGNTCATDNCASVFNNVQRDTDVDGRGDLCDVCPSTSNSGQADADGDGAGDVCDCQASDPNDRTPAAVSSMTASKPAAGTIALSWSAVTGADAYSITRGDLDSVASGTYGACLAQGVTATSYSDAATPASGLGFVYLVQAQNYDCGLGTLGRDSTEAERTNGAGACTGNAHTDSHATGESAVFGTTTGALSNITASDNLVQTITEEVTGGSPSTRVSRLEHRWTFSLGAGTLKQLHVEGFRSTSTDGDNFRFEYSTDGVNFTAITLASLPFADNGIDLVGTLPAGVTGAVTIRVVDTDRTPGNQAVDSVSLDEVFLRSAP
jgi:N-acetylneuraminic acid mutarotase